MPPSFDVAVLGLGAMGSFACLELARRGASVIAFDRFSPPHPHGSHSGDTRVYREAYAEHPAYVPIAQRAGRLWDRYGSEAGHPLLHRCGMLSVGPESSALLAGIRQSASLHGLEVQTFSSPQIRGRFPALQPPPGAIGLFEPAAGWIDVNASLRFAIESARNLGAVLRLNTPVGRCTPDRDGFLLHTSAETFRSSRVIVAAGAWAGSLLSELNLPLRVLRKVLVWVDPLEPDLFRPGRFPVFAFSDRFFYGFPNIAGRGVKVSIHLDPQPTPAQPGVDQPPVLPAEIEAVLAPAREYLPRLAGPLPHASERVLTACTCLYTMTPDEHFIIDRHPYLENLWIAAGFSGHGFKFAPAIGEALADCALGGGTSLPIVFLGLRRFFTPA